MSLTFIHRTIWNLSISPSIKGQYHFSNETHGIENFLTQLEKVDNIIDNWFTIRELEHKINIRSYTNDVRCMYIFILTSNLRKIKFISTSILLNIKMNLSVCHYRGKKFIELNETTLHVKSSESYEEVWCMVLCTYVSILTAVIAISIQCHYCDNVNKNFSAQLGYKKNSTLVYYFLSDFRYSQSFGVMHSFKN